MYVRSYKTLPQGTDKTDSEKPLDASDKEDKEKTIDKTEPQAKKSRYKARRKMPEFHPPHSEPTSDNTPHDSENTDSHTPENTEKSTHAPLYTQNEMLVLAVTVLLLLEGADDILILALGYTLCP
jgi:hypothetical protein